MALTKIDDRGLKTPIDLLDNEKIRFGTGNDLEVFHNGTDSFVKNTTGQLCLNSDEFGVANAAYTENIIRGTANGAVKLFYDNANKLETTSTGVSVTGVITTDSGGSTTTIDIVSDTESSVIFTDHGGSAKQYKIGTNISSNDGQLEFKDLTAGTKRLEITSGGNVRVPDNGKFVAGAGDDLQIYHDGTDSYLDNSTGELALRSDTIRLREKTGNETLAVFERDGAAKLYYDNAKHFETTATGVSWGTTRLRCDDNGMIELGTSQDLQIYHNGTNSLIENGTGELLIRAKTSENSINCNPDAGTEIFYDNSKKFETQDTGVKVYGDYFTNDGNKINLGGSNDLQIYHDGSHSYIKDSGTGDLVLQASTARIINAAATENIARFFENGSCELYYDNGKRLGTTSAGISINRQNAGEYFNVNANYGGSGDQAIEVSGDLTFYTNATSIAARLDQDGLKFNADTAAANALGDYETGTFSLVMNPGGNSYSVSHMQAQYTKVGNVCHIQGWWRCSTAHSVSGSLTVQGFPFAAYNNTGSGGLRQTLSAQVANANGNATDIVIQLNDNATTGTIKSTTNMGAGRYEWVATNIEDTTAVYINGSYLTT